MDWLLWSGGSPRAPGIGVSVAATDRTYWHVPGARSWHATAPGGALCGRTEPANLPESAIQVSDRVPRDGHLCGSCSRIIAARTDVEP